MAQYVGLDVSLEETSLCVVDETGAIVFEGKAATDPHALSALLHRRAPAAERIGLESGSLTPWLWHGLRALGHPVICLDARQAHATLTLRPNKSDRNDARGLAELVRLGWGRQVQVKSLDSHRRHALLAARDQLVRMQRALDNQLRGLLRPFGHRLGKGTGQSFLARIAAVSAAEPALAPIIASLLPVREQLVRQMAALERQVRQIVRGDADLRRMLSVPGVGPITALAVASVIDDPSRFSRSSSVGAYLGLTPRRYQSGEIDRQGRISKCGDRLARAYLFEAANVLLTKVQRWSPLKAWGLRLAQRIGMRKAKVAVARKLAAILHCIWTDGTEFWWTKEQAAM